MGRKMIARVVLGAVLAIGSLVAVPAGAASKHGCQILDTDQYSPQRGVCSYVATSSRARVTAVAQEWIINIKNPYGDLVDVVYCDHRCVGTITFRTYRGGRVHFFLYHGYGKIGDK